MGVNRCLPPSMLCMIGRAVFSPLACVQSLLPPVKTTKVHFRFFIINSVPSQHILTMVTDFMASQQF